MSSRGTRRNIGIVYFRRSTSAAFAASDAPAIDIASDAEAIYAADDERTACPSEALNEERSHGWRERRANRAT
jgi:hypothetical protein